MLLIIVKMATTSETGVERDTERDESVPKNNAHFLVSGWFGLETRSTTRSGSTTNLFQSILHVVM